MSQSATPSQIAGFLRAIASGIDRSKKPDPKRVASDLKCVLASMDGDEKAVARVAAVVAAAKPEEAAVQPYKVSFTSSFSPESFKNAADEIIRRKPVLAGKKLRITVTAEPADKA